MTTLYLYSVEDKETFPVTDGWFDSYAPAFSADGKVLYFVSERHFSPVFSQTEWNHAYVDLAGIYLITLARDTKSPFAPKSDEVKISAKEEPKKEDTKGEKKKPDVTVVVDPEGIQNRIAALPVSGSSYRDLVSAGDKLYYVRSGSKDTKPTIQLFDFEKQKETDLGEFNGFEISADKKKMLVGEEGSFAIIDLPTSKIEIKDRLSLTDMTMQLDHHAEWHQIFRECWRQMREFFFSPTMNGVDWPAMKSKYEPLVDFVNHRADLTYIIGEMIAELNSGHAYVGGGEYPKPERVPMGLLGATLERDPSSGYYRIKKILRGQNWDKAARSPLTEIGVNASEGEYILAVNGRPTNTMPDIYAAFVNTAGKQVTLKLNKTPGESGSHETVVVPVDNDKHTCTTHGYRRISTRFLRQPTERWGTSIFPIWGSTDSMSL